MAKICFFSKINLVKAEKKYLHNIFLAFESQDNVKFEYI